MPGTADAGQMELVCWSLCAATTPVGEEAWELEPPLLVAVTTLTIVWPTSALESLYEADVAATMSTHCRPDASQSCHWSAKLVGVFVHEPFEVVRVSPCCAVPEMIGGAVFVGRLGGGGGAAVVPVTYAEIEQVGQFEPLLQAGGQRAETQLS